jgi:hypothetical protein
MNPSSGCDLKRALLYKALPIVIKALFKLHSEDGFMKAETCCCYALLIIIIKIIIIKSIVPSRNIGCL